MICVPCRYLAKDDLKDLCQEPGSEFVECLM